MSEEFKAVFFFRLSQLVAQHLIKAGHQDTVQDVFLDVVVKAGVDWGLVSSALSRRDGVLDLSRPEGLLAVSKLVQEAACAIPG